jgi:predicted enzyme related to lactoylglutathione lyase
VSQRQIENTIRVLTVRHLERSIAFYGEVLGFDLEWNAGELCSVARDRCSIMLQRSEEPCSGTVWIGLDGDSLIAALEKSGVTILQPPSNQPWAYEMKIADPDGNVIWLGAEPKATHDRVEVSRG